MVLVNVYEHDLEDLKDLDIQPQLDVLFPLHSTIENTRFNALMLYLEKVNKIRS